MIYLNDQALAADFVEAYKWFHLAATGRPSIDRAAAACRKMEKELTPEEVAEAKRRAAEIQARQTYQPH